jgi:hypothetical protein
MNLSIQNIGLEFINLIMKGWVIDTRAGGLVIGRSHDQGNIYMFRFIYNVTSFKISFAGNIEGGEYIVNYSSYLHSKKRFDEINNFYEPTTNISDIKLTEKSRFFNTHATPSDKLLLIENNHIFVINKFATAKHFEEIEHLNSLNNSFLTCDICKLVPKDAFNNRDTP